MVFSTLLLSSSWDFGRDRKILDVNNCPADGDGELVWPTVLNPGLMGLYSQ